MMPLFAHPQFRVLLVVALLALPACQPTPTPEAPFHLRIGTSDSSQYIAREVASAFRRAHPLTTFDFFTSNSTTALRQLAFGQFDIAFVERNPRADELERASATAYELGRDGVFVIVHPSNKMENLAREDLAKIFAGEFNQWTQLGVEPPNGRDEIQVLAREEGAGMRAVIDEKVMQGARLTPTALLLPTNLDMLDYVAEHPNAIGYVAANIWAGDSRTRSLGIDGVPASRETLQEGTYPLAQTVFLIAPQTPNTEIGAFLDFLAGPDGRGALYQRISEIPPK